MPHTRLRPTYTFDADRLAQLSAVVPEAFADGKIDWDTLRDLLGDTVEDPAVEHFGLSWPGKREARRLASRPSRGALIPIPREGVNEDTTRNIFIEGENLEVLKLLLKSYAGRVKMIYIDPPYNTGNDFIYSDKFSQPLDAYLRLASLADEQGPLQSNPKTSGRYHSNWLNMMYPRLVLARSLLRDDALIFVSIDDNEVANLRMMMDELFGEENFLAQIVWKNVYGGGSKTKYIVAQHEYVLCYARSKEALQAIELPPDPDARKRYTERDDKYPIRGPYFTQPLGTTSMDFRPNLRFPIYYQNEEIWPEKQWQWSRERVEEALRNNELVFNKQNGKWSVRYKQYLYDAEGTERGSKLFSVNVGPWTQEGTADIRKYFGDNKVFPFPKPAGLIRSFVSFTWLDENAIVLDFFAGSSPTAQAVLELNTDLNCSLRFIMVQLPEPTPPGSAANSAGFASIAEIGKQRIRHVVSETVNKQAEQLPLDGSNSETIGFRVYRLDRTHFKPWTDYSGDDVAMLQAQFDAFESPLVDGWKPDDLLVEIMLTEGFPLDSAVTRQPQFAANDVRLVESDFHEHRLWVCLDQRVEPSTASALAMADNDVFICLDGAVGDEMKLRLSDSGNLKTI